MADLSKIVTSQAIEITDGVSQTAVLLASNPVGTEAALVTRVIPSGTQNIAGTITAIAAGTQAISGTITSVPSGISTVNQPDATTTGTITTTDSVVGAPSGTGVLLSGSSTAGSLVAIACPGGDSSWTMQITGLTSGTLYFEVSLDSTTGTDGSWVSVNGRQTGVVNTILSNNAATSGIYRGNTCGVKYLRIRSVGSMSGTPTVNIRISTGPGAIFLNASIPAGTNTIGTVSTIPSGTQAVTGTVSTVSSGTQTVSGTVTSVPSGTTSISGTVTSVSSGTTPVAGTVSVSGTLPISGTVTNVPSGTSQVAGTVAVTGTVTSVPSGTTVISNSNLISTANSSTTALAASGTYTGTAWEDVSPYGLVTVIVYSDQSSAANGLTFNWSSNASTIDDTETFSVPAGNGYSFSLTPEARYVKITYTNGTTAQSTFHLQTIYKVDAPVMTLGRSRKTNPLAEVSDGQRIGMCCDGIGRLVTTPFHVRQMTTRSVVVVTTTTETTLVTATAGAYNDMTSVLACNLGAAAVRADIRDTTAGTVVFSLNIPASGQASINFTQPLNQAAVNTNWTAALSATPTTGIRFTVTSVINV